MKLSNTTALASIALLLTGALHAQSIVQTDPDYLLFNATAYSAATEKWTAIADQTTSPSFADEVMVYWDTDGVDASAVNNVGTTADTLTWTLDFTHAAVYHVFIRVQGEFGGGGLNDSIFHAKDWDSAPTSVANSMGGSLSSEYQWIRLTYSDPDLPMGLGVESFTTKTAPWNLTIDATQAEPGTTVTYSIAGRESDLQIDQVAFHTDPSVSASQLDAIAGVPSVVNLGLGDYRDYYVSGGPVNYTVSDVSSSGATLERTADDDAPFNNGNLMGMYGFINTSSLTSFTKIGDTMTYRFHLGNLSIPGNSDAPIYRVGFDFGSTALCRYATSIGTGGEIEFASNDNGRMSTAGTVHASYTDWASDAPTDLSALRMDDGNELDVTLSLELVGVSGSAYNYEMTVTYASTIDPTKTNTKSHTFTDVEGAEVVAVVHLTDSADFSAGSRYTVSDASLEFLQGEGGIEDPALVELQTQVDALPDSTPDEQVKKAVLQVAVERAINAHAVSLVAEKERLISDVQGALSQAAPDFTARNPEAPEHLPILLPLVTPYENNPELQELVQEVTDELAVADVPWARALDYNDIIQVGGDYGSRNAAQLMGRYLWLFGHEESPMKFDPELLKRVLRRAHAYMDSYELGPDFSGNPAPNWTDQFAMSNAFPPLWEIRSLYPGLLLPSQVERWDAIMEPLAISMQNLRSLARNYSPWNINIETARNVGALVTAYWTGNQYIINRVYDHMDRTTARVLPDGALPYHGLGSPSVNYHNEMTDLYITLYALTGYEPLLDALVKMQWKGPVMGRTDEFWTSPHYKTYRWNFQDGTEAGNEAAATLSGNPYLRGLLDRETDRFAGADLIDAVWFDADGVDPKPLPDNYTIADRNVGGPRAWYGEFTYAGSFDPNPPSTGYEGHETVMGAMTVDPADGRLNSILTDVTPRIWQTPEETMEAERYTLSAWADLTINEVPATTITRNYSVSTMIHGTTRRRADAYRTGSVSGWTSRQVWLGFPDRIVGLVSTVPTADEAAAYAVNGVLRLISGGTAGAATTKVLEEIVPDEHYRYGQLDVFVHDTTYTSLSGFEVAYRVPQYPATELTFSNRASEPLPVGSESTFPANTEYRFVVEVRPTWTTTDLTSVSVLGDQDIIGLEVISDERSLQVWLNAAESDQSVTLHRETLPMGEDSFVLSDGVLGRMSFSSTVPSSVNLEPGQHALLVVSSDPDDHRVGWESFIHLVGEAWADYETNVDGWFDTGDWLGQVYPMEDWVYSDLLSNYLYLRQEWIREDSGCFAFAHRDPSVPSLVDGVPLEGDVLPDSGWVNTQSWLGWLYMAEQGWAYSLTLQDWIWIQEPGAGDGGGWVYFM